MIKFYLVLGAIVLNLAITASGRAEASCKAQCDQYRANASSKDSATLWQQVGPHCEALDLLGKGISSSKRAALAYTVASAACGTACGLEHLRDVSLGALIAKAKAITVAANSCIPAKVTPIKTAVSQLTAINTVYATTCTNPIPANVAVCSNEARFWSSSVGALAQCEGIGDGTGATAIGSLKPLTASTLHLITATQPISITRGAMPLMAADKVFLEAQAEYSAAQKATVVATDALEISADLCAAAIETALGLGAGTVLATGFIPTLQTNAAILAAPCAPTINAASAAYLAAEASAVSLTNSTEIAVITCDGTGVAAGAMDIAEAAKIKGAVTDFLRGTSVVATAGAGAIGWTPDMLSGECTLAGVLAAAAATRFYSAKSSTESEEKECKTISRYASMAAANNYKMAQAPKPLSYSGSLSGAGRAGNQLTGLNMSPQEAASNFPKNLLPQQGAAKADPFAKIFDKMPNSSKIPDALAKMGGSLEQIAGALESGNSPGSILAAAMGGASPQMANEFRNLDAAMAKYMKIEGAGTVTASGGPRGGGSKSPDLGFSFGNLFGAKGGEAGPGAAKSVSFGRTPASAEADIWHSAYPGTIFQIISSKISASRDKVEDLEWVTPINRAMAGGQRGQSKPAFK